jgi:hypothetical protein
MNSDSDSSDSDSDTEVVVEVPMPRTKKKTPAKKKNPPARKKKSPAAKKAVADRDVFLDGTDAAAIAVSMADKKTKESTKKNYSYKHKYVVEYLGKHSPSDLLEEGGEIKIPMDDVLKSFFGYIMASAFARAKLKSPDEIPDGEPDPWSVSQITGFKSAIVSLYTAKNMKLGESLETQLTRLLRDG